MKRVNGKRVPCSKKKRIQNKYIPKGIYCHGDSLNHLCPFWTYRVATLKDMREIYDREIAENNGLFDGKKMTFEEAVKFMQSDKESEYFTDVYECKLINYTEYCQESLLWDQCKECGRNEGSFFGERTCTPIPNNVRRKSPKERQEWLKENSFWY